MLFSRSWIGARIGAAVVLSAKSPSRCAPALLMAMVFRKVAAAFPESVGSRRLLNASAVKQCFGDFEDFFDRLEAPRWSVRGEDVAGARGGGDVTGALRGWGG